MPWPEDQIADGRVKAYPADTRLRWQDHIDAAITDLRNSDRSPFEQRVYDALRQAFGHPV